MSYLLFHYVRRIRGCAQVLNACAALGGVGQGCAGSLPVNPGTGIATAAGNGCVTFSYWMFAELSVKNEEYGNKCGYQAETSRAR